MATQDAPPHGDGKELAGDRTPDAPAKWWCNFCGFATDDQKQYLQHSCTEELARQGRTIEPTGQNECR